jgi:hypothetical protein
MIRFVGTETDYPTPYFVLPYEEWVRHCRARKYDPVPQEIDEIQAAIERQAWTEVLEPIMKELNLLPEPRNYDYLCVDDLKPIIEAIRKLKDK